MLRGVEVTVGHEQEEGGKWPYAGTAEAIRALGAKHCVKDVAISFACGGPRARGSLGQAVSAPATCRALRGRLRTRPWPCFKPPSPGGPLQCVGPQPGERVPFLVW